MTNKGQQSGALATPRVTALAWALPPIGVGRRGQTLVAKLVLFALAIALPMLMLATGAIWQQRSADRAKAEAALVAQAHSTALLLDREFAGGERVLLALARSSRLVSGDITGFSNQMRDAAVATGALAINLVAAEGRVVLSTEFPPGQRPAMIGSASMLRTLETGRTVIGNLFVRPYDGSHAVGVTVPVRCPAGVGEAPARCALGLVIPRARMLVALTEQRLPPSAFAAVLDRENLIVARSSRDAEFVGTRPAQSLLDAMLQPAGMIPFAYVSLEGRRVVAAYAQAPESGYRVKIVVPEEIFDAPLLATLWPTLLAGMLLLAASLALGVASARRIAAAFSTLGAADLPERPTRVGLRELDDLADALSRKAGARARAMAELRSLFDASPVGMVRCDAGGRVYEANAAFLRIVGMSRAELEAGRVKWDQLTPPEWIGRDEAAIAEAARTGACAPYQKEYVRPDGTRVPALVFFAFEGTASGRAAAFVVDLSPWGATEAALVRVQEQMRLAIDGAGMFFWDANLVTGEVEWSPGLEQTCAMQPGSFGGTMEAFRALVRPEDLPRVEAALAAANAGNPPYEAEYRILRADGAERWLTLRTHVLPGSDGRLSRCIGINRDVTDRKLAEPALRASEERFRSVSDATPDVIYISSVVEGRVEYLSPSFETIWGEPRDAIMADRSRWIDLLHEDDRAAAVAQKARFLAEATAPMSMEYRIRRASDGAVRHIRDTAVPIRDAVGQVVSVAGVAHDDTDRRQAEMAGAASASLFRSVAEAMPAMIFVADAEGRNTFTNARMQQYTGLTAEELAADAWRRIVHPDDLALTLARWQRSVSTGEPYETEYRLRRKDGAWRWHLARSVLDHDDQGAIIRWLGAAIDVDDRHAAAGALNQAQEGLRLAVEAAELGIWNCDLRDGTAQASARCAELYGLAPDETLDLERLLAALHPDDQAVTEAAIATALAEHDRYDVEHRVLLAEGEIRWRRATGRGSYGPDGAALGLRGVMVDIDRRKRIEAELRDSHDQLEQRVAERTHALTLAASELTAEMRRREQAQSALVQAQKLEALGQLTSGIAHDFNNVLAAVLGSLKLIRRRAPEGEPIAELARNGEAAANRAATLVRRLMAFARREDLAPAALDPTAVLAEAETLVRHAVGAGVQVVTKVPAGIWPLVVDAHQLEVALLNLAVNARDAMQGRGQVKLAARNAPAESLAARPLGLRPNIDYVVLSMHDNGPGMPPDVLARATEAFFTTKPRGHGTGLGLAMVQTYARQSGGALHIESTTGEGTTVELWLPRGAEMPQPNVDGGSEELDDALHGNATILVVDDDEQVRLVVATTLRDLGYTVLEANSADTAMVQALAAPRLDLMLTDVVMPGGDGPELAARLRAALPGVPVLFVTGFAGDHKMSGEVVLVKPYPVAQLAFQVLVALGRVQPPDRILRQLRLPVVRHAYLGWRVLRQAAGPDRLPRPDAAEMTALAALPDAFTVKVTWSSDGTPVLRYDSFGRALAQRLGSTLAGSLVGDDAGDGDLFQGLAAMYRLCAVQSAPVSDYARYQFDDHADRLRFERLVLPLAADGGRRVTMLLGLALFEDPAQH